MPGPRLLPPGEKALDRLLGLGAARCHNSPEKAGSVCGAEPRTRPQVELQTVGTGARRQPGTGA